MLRISSYFDRLSDANLHLSASGILAALTGNMAFPDPKPDLATLSTLLDAFDSALAAAQDGGRTDIAFKNQKREELITLLNRLGDYVVFAAAGDANKAATSGFTLAHERTSQPQLQRPEGLLVEDGANAGELHISFNRVKNARSYMYQYTLDPLTDASVWQGHTGTVAQADFTHLQSGRKYWCRVIAVGINGQTVISDAISRMVQ